jgi:flavodoxin
MVKVIIVYESKYGNTRLVAETIAEGLREIPGIDAVLREIKDVDMKYLAGFDTILIGSPNHIGNATRKIRKFIDRLGKAELKGKTAVVFDTYLGGDFEKAVGKMEKQIAEKVPGLKLPVPGLSIMVEGMKGPIAEGELTKCKDFGVKVAAHISSAA